MTSTASDLLLPHSNWEPPKELPDLSRFDTIAVDLETCDPDLLIKGPGWVPGGRGFICGIAYSVGPGGPTGYLPIAHESGTNLDRDRVLHWAMVEFGRPYQTKVFHNAQYDVGWLENIGVEVRGPIQDTQLLAAILDEGRRTRKRYYTLDDLAGEYLGRRKDESLLRDAARSCGCDPKNELWKLPPPFVGPYAEQDARLTLELWQTLWINCEDQDLEQVVELECGLIRTSLAMRRRGVRVDVERAERLLYVGGWLEYLARQNVDRAAEGRDVHTLPTLEYLMENPPEAAGGAAQMRHSVDIWSGRALARLYDKLGLSYPLTEERQPCFEKEVLGADPHPVSQAIHIAKRINRSLSYVKTQVLGNLRYGERVHPNWSQLMDDEYGTITGRYSCSSPALHGCPRRDPLVGQLVRSLFLPEPGDTWISFDYNQQEPRLVVHYASLMKLEGADEAVRFYDDSKADYHQMVADMFEVSRGEAKTYNLGLLYGMGSKKLGEKLGLGVEPAHAFWARYHARLPYVLELARAAQRKAQADGYVRTILGRRCRFDLFEPRRPFEEKRRNPLAALPRADAEKEWPNEPLERAFTYRALPRLIQGSAADQTKQAMLYASKIEGVTLLAQVHDELCFSLDLSYPGTRIQQIVQAMIGTLPLKVPVKVDMRVGSSWGG